MLGPLQLREPVSLIRWLLCPCVAARQKSKVWVFGDDPTPTMAKRQRAMKKVMNTVSFRSTGLVKAIKLEGQKRVTVNWYTTKCLQEILEEGNVMELILPP
ncbi:uncharacterized protein TNCV_1797521 [Trichonephila clavipes]|nr:uncharacterized protein TNCV_1797521 [Trichonephila clavipes]